MNLVPQSRTLNRETWAPKHVLEELDLWWMVVRSN